MKLYRSRVYSPLASPFSIIDPAERHLYHEDGFIAVDDDGRIRAVAPWGELTAEFRNTEIVNLGPGALITPGFVDTHLHAPQLEMIGSYGGHLLEWLNRYTFPTEMKFADPVHAETIARALFDELLRNGTLTALIFSTVHTEATEIFFREAERRGFRGIIGKTMMDRNAPAELLEDSEASYRGCRELLKRWHGKGLLHYAVTPRFAPTSTPRLLELAGRLKAEYPDVWVHTHISENRSEVQWVRELFPESPSYAAVYDRFGLLSDRTVLAHGVHLTPDELELLSARGARISHCPNSNLFLGSGLFGLQRTLDSGVAVGLGTDIGAGTTPSMFTAMADAYKVQQVQGVSLSPFQLWYLGTLGGAHALSLDDRTGSLEPGKDADFLVLDLHATPLISLRTERASSIEDLLAGLIFMGDDRLVRKSFIRGREVAARPA